MNSMLEYKGYHATIEYDAEDDIFVGEVFGITGLFGMEHFQDRSRPVS